MEIKLDQHFMENEDILDIIANVSKITKEDTILEIGPGKGSLTKKILNKNPKQLISVEKDIELEEELSKINNKIFKLIIGDGLDEINRHSFNKLVANIPYAITEPLYKKILDKQIPFIVMLHGIDFYKNLVERETKWKYFVSAFYNIKLVEEVSGDMFIPKTKVKSVILKLELKDKLNKEEIFYQNLYLRRDRNTRNAIIFSLVESGLTKKEAKGKVIKLDLDDGMLNKKLDNLSNEEFMKITQIL